MFRLLYLFFVAFSVVTSSPLLEIKDETVKSIQVALHDLCVAKTGVKAASIEDGKKGILDRDPKLMEYWTCVWTSSGLMDKKGDIEYDLVGAMCPPNSKDAVMKSLKNCHDKASGEKVLSSLILKMTQCISTTDPEHFLMF